MTLEPAALTCRFQAFCIRRVRFSEKTPGNQKFKAGKFNISIVVTTETQVMNV